VNAPTAVAWLRVDWRGFARLLRGVELRGSATVPPATLVERLTATYPETGTWSRDARIVDGARQTMAPFGEYWPHEAGEEGVQLRRARPGRLGSGAVAEIDITPGGASGSTASVRVRADRRVWASLLIVALMCLAGLSAVTFGGHVVGLVLIAMALLYTFWLGRTTVADAAVVRNDIDTALGSLLTPAPSAASGAG